MTDPLAHLYAETGADDPGDTGAGVPLETVTLEDLVATGPEPETITDHDLEELVILVKDRILAGTMTDEDAVDLGLGDLVESADPDDLDPSLALNHIGVLVFRRLVVDRVVDLNGQPLTAGGTGGE